MKIKPSFCFLNGIAVAALLCSCTFRQAEPGQIRGKWRCYARDCGRGSAETPMEAFYRFSPDGSYEVEFDGGKADRERGVWRLDADHVILTTGARTCRWQFRAPDRMEIREENREFFPRGILLILKKESSQP